MVRKPSYNTQGEAAFRTGDTLSKKIAARELTSKMSTRQPLASTATTRRNRFVLLNMQNPMDNQFLQILHNRPDKFEIASSKESHQRGEYVYRVHFYELGEDLPVVKGQDTLIAEYIVNLEKRDVEQPL